MKRSVDGPRPPIPAPLRGIEEDTWTHTSVVVRLPNIARRVIQENDFPLAINRQLEALAGEIPASPIRPLADADAPDAADWEAYVAPYRGQNWLEVPWFFAEYYFYRRILEATRYFHPGEGQPVDPFAYQKQQGVVTALDTIRALSARQEALLHKDPWGRKALGELLVRALWGNQADLSLWPAGAEDNPHGEIEQQRADQIIVDDTDRVADYLSRIVPCLRIDLILDNAGLETVTDLCLADYLLGANMVQAVHLHLKSYPVFVSDAMVKDIWATIDVLAGDEDEHVQALAVRLRRYLDEGRLHLASDVYWSSPLCAWEMPYPVRADLARSQLVISKGDANYRRLLGDRHWPPTTPFADIVRSFPAPLVVLRTLKSEVIAGLKPGQAKALARRDPEWLVNGKRGQVQFANPLLEVG
jgi:uncharacterized protein with ATP-grasp and redox domains